MLFYLFIVKKVSYRDGARSRGNATSANMFVVAVARVVVFLADENGVFMVTKANSVAKYAIMFAIIIVATLLDRVITLGLPIAGATVELLVTFALCFLCNSWLDGFAAFAFMGLSSFALSFPFGKISSQNPLISIVPRLIVGVVAFAVYRLVLYIGKRNQNKRLVQTCAMVSATAVGLATNTILFMGALTLFTSAYGSLAEALKAVAILNVLPEYLVSLVGVVPVVFGVRRGLKLGIDGNNQKHAANAVDVATPYSDVAQDETDNIADSQN